MGKKKKKDSLLERIANASDEQEARIKGLITLFYPNGQLAELIPVNQIEKCLGDIKSLKKFSEDEPARTDCIRIFSNTKDMNSNSIELDFYSSTVRYRGTKKNQYFDFDSRIMLKGISDDNPLYLKEGFIEDSYNVVFLINTDEEEAFMLIEGYDFCEGVRDRDYTSGERFFARLSEFHAIIRGYGDDSLNYEYFIISFSKNDKRFFVEQVYNDLNKELINKILPSDEDKANVNTNEPSSSSDLPPEKKDTDIATEENDTPTPPKKDIKALAKSVKAGMKKAKNDSEEADTPDTA